MHVATATGYGLPNYALQRYFRDLVEKEELNPDRAALLRNVITDAYFRGLRNPADPTDPDPAKKDEKGVALNAGGGQNPGGGGLGPAYGGAGGPGPMYGGAGMSGGGRPGGLPGASGSLQVGSPEGGPGQATATPPEDDPVTLLRKKRARLYVKAQATSWALYHYLASDRPAELRRFLDELAALPRDLPLDDATVLAAFNRAFNLDGSKAAHARFADGWLNYMRSLPPAGVDVPLVDPKPTTGNQGPGAGMGPMIGGPGGGGRPGGGS
jgi:hypothetical protein